ncbi:unnamed protein product [Echinostoma caproni]|uniref:ATP synthase-coupling factor 6, mitochondrial n=1 Tax=Echinostoma caproni TaxID=27848 RepID=A0A183AZI4_9TREM|nr:unnamed protein product [Echinostoma caproni]
MGNIVTVCRVIRQKLFLPPPSVVRFQLSRKYSFAKPQIDSVELAELRRKYNFDHDNTAEQTKKTNTTNGPKDEEVFVPKEGKKTA